ncbi:MAG: tRNA (adenosine(37)-N6)-threonylcarbamoyltransferase complex dimerization subunit type 1 TsaB [Parachlamydiaceae bacterium]|nr:tRNA (adenosine(37)-N6)-threonylcarbamoyltransferase complex dimerization subunit type 1 TsaB [Parachlamydiaceae bacterium]
MPILILDTSTERGFVAILEGLQLLYHVQLPFGMQNAQSLLPEIHRGLAFTGFSINQMEFVGVGIGPGSYTGMRVGATVAKTLTFACGLPLVGVCSLDAFVPLQAGAYAAIIDAKVGGVYLQTGYFGQGVVTELSGPQIYSINEAAEMLLNVPVLVTPNATQLRPKLEKELASSQWRWEESFPSPMDMARRARQKIERQEFSLNGHLDLLYLRKTQAEIEKEKMRS